MEPRDFKAIRAYLELSQGDLGAQLGYSTVQISKYETGKAEIPAAVKLAMWWLEHEAQADE